MDELKKKVTWLHLGPKGKYRQQRPKQGTLSSAMSPGFWMRSAWLWSDPRRKIMATLKEILSGK